MFELTINESIKLTIEIGSFICIENIADNTAKYYDWEEYLKLDPSGEESSCKALKILENVYGTFEKKLKVQSHCNSQTF